MQATAIRWNAAPPVFLCMDHQPEQTDASVLWAPDDLHSGRDGSAGAFAVLELSHYKFEPLRQDGEFLLSRGRLLRCTDGSPSPILALTPVGEYPAPAILRRLEHEYTLRAALEPAWAVRSLVLTQQQGRPLLVLEDPGAPRVYADLAIACVLVFKSVSPLSLRAA